MIPVLNERDTIAGQLEDLSARFPGSELIVVDGGSTDETVRQALPLCSSLLVSPPGRAGQMNMGADVARGEYVFFLHADSLPTIDSAGLANALTETPDWGFCRVRLSGRRTAFRVIEWAMNHRSRLTGVATGDQMLFVRRDVLVHIGGFARIPLMEDVEICKRLRRLGPPLILAQPVVTSSRRWEERGVLATVMQMWVLRLEYFFGVSPHTLWRQYYGR